MRREVVERRAPWELGRVDGRISDQSLDWERPIKFI